MKNQKIIKLICVSYAAVSFMYATDADPMDDLLSARTAENTQLEKDRIAAEQNKAAKRPVTELDLKKAYVKRATEIADTAEHDLQQLLEIEKQERVEKRWSELEMYFGNEVKVNVRENKAPVNDLLWGQLKKHGFEFSQQMEVAEYRYEAPKKRGEIIDLHDNGKPYIFQMQVVNGVTQALVLIYDIEREEGLRKKLIAVPIAYRGDLVDGGIYQLIESLQKMPGSKAYKAKLFKDIVSQLKRHLNRPNYEVRDSNGVRIPDISEIRRPDNFRNYHQDYMQLLAFYNYLRTDIGVSKQEALDTVFGTLEGTPYSAQFKVAWNSDGGALKELVNGSDVETEIAGYFENMVADDDDADDDEV